jgi:hypothetical protein
MHPSSLHRRTRRLNSYLEPLRRAVVADLIEDPDRLVVDSALLSVLHLRQVGNSAPLRDTPSPRTKARRHNWDRGGCITGIFPGPMLR